MKFFVSYSRSVKNDVFEVIQLLRASGHDVWWDGDVPMIEDWWATIIRNIEWCEVLVFMISEKSVQSAYCMAELRYAIARNRPVLPFILDDYTRYTIPEDFGRRQWYVHNGNAQRMLEQITHDCHAIDWKKHADTYAPRPAEPNTDAGTIVKLFQQAVTLAESGHFEEALKRLRNVMSLDFENWGEDCQQWVEQIQRYADIADLADHKATRARALRQWNDYLKRFDAEFDPLNVREKLSNITAPVKLPPIIQVPIRKSILPAPFEWIQIPGKGYWIAKYPVTNAQFARFIEGGGYQHKKWWTDAGWQIQEKKAWTQPRFWGESDWCGDEQPVVGVSWYEAVAFCLWLGDVLGERVMLPTEDQWQYAAQGEDGREFPWGSEWDVSRCNSKLSGLERTLQVRGYEGKGDSPFGVVDMAGNVWEWCLTDYDQRTNDINSGGSKRVLRGGSWVNGFAEYFQVDHRFKYAPQYGNLSWGFRIAYS